MSLLISVNKIWRKIQFIETAVFCTTTPRSELGYYWHEATITNEVTAIAVLLTPSIPPLYPSPLSLPSIPPYILSDLPPSLPLSLTPSLTPSFSFSIVPLYSDSKVWRLLDKHTLLALSLLYSVSSLLQERIRYRPEVSRGGWHARDNAATFLLWCKRFKVKSEVLFESDGLGTCWNCIGWFLPSDGLSCDCHVIYMF